MSNKKALYAGTFDPFTKGHEDIVARALNIFDEVIIVVAVSPSKKPFLTGAERISMIGELYANNKNVQVDQWDSLIVDYAKKNNIVSIIRGLRGTGDFEPEFQMASMNRKLHPDADTIFLMAGEHNYYISSSLVKEIFTHGGDIKDFVPSQINNWLEKEKRG